jgi:hypothetical protein
MDVVYERLDTLGPRLQNKCLSDLRKTCDRYRGPRHSFGIPQKSHFVATSRMDRGGCTGNWKGQQQVCHVVVKVLRPRPDFTSNFETMTSVSGLPNAIRVPADVVVIYRDFAKTLGLGGLSQMFFPVTPCVCGIKLRLVHAARPPRHP